MFPLVWSCQIPLISCIFYSDQIPLISCIFFRSNSAHSLHFLFRSNSAHFLHFFYRFRSFRSNSAHSGHLLHFFDRNLSGLLDLGSLNPPPQIMLNSIMLKYGTCVCWVQKICTHSWGGSTNGKDPALNNLS